MPSDLSTKIQNALWWITSIATSVVCCSVIFVLFASYFVDVREDIRDNNRRISVVEEREEKILNEIQMIRKHGLGQADAPAASAATSAAPPSADAAPEKGIGSIEIPVTPSPSASAPDVPSTAPAVTVPVAPLPQLTPPSMAPAPDKK